MSINDYTTVSVSKRNFNFSQFFTYQLEPLLLSFMLLAGIIGSFYIFGEKLISDSSLATEQMRNNPEKSFFSAALIGDSENVASNSFDEYFSMDKKISVGKDFTMTFLKDEKASRYVMEMGDGMRLIITQKNLYYQYAEPGTYYIELKEIKDGLMNIVATKKIKVK